MAKKASTKTTPVDGGGKPLGPECRIVLLIGKDLFVRAESTKLLRQALEKAHGEVDTMNFDGAAATPAEILDECRSFGLIARHKLLIVDDAERVVKEHSRDLFERYAKEPSDGATLVLRSDKLIPGNFGKLVEQVGAVISCEPPTRDAAIKWVLKECKKRHDIEIDPAAATLLVDQVGPTQAHLDTELAKLAVAACGNPAITTDLVSQFVDKTRDEDIWQVQRTVIQASNAGRIESIRYAINVLRQPPTLVLFALTDLARKLHVISRGTKSGARPDIIRKAAKLWGPGGDELFSLGASIDWRRATAIYRGCVDADRRAKSGLGDAARSAELAALRFPRTGR
jgi:DNA polymerase III delta subunit